jgi:hypothetical protein
MTVADQNKVEAHRSISTIYQKYIKTKRKRFNINEINGGGLFQKVFKIKKLINLESKVG